MSLRKPERSTDFVRARGNNILWDRLAEAEKQVTIARLEERKKCSERIAKVREIDEDDLFKVVYTFPILRKFCFENKVPITSMCNMILLSKLDRANVTEFRKFAVPVANKLYIELKSMVEQDLVIRLEVPKTLTGRKGVPNKVGYTLTMKGRRILGEFKSFYKKKVKELMASDEYKKSNI